MDIGTECNSWVTLSVAWYEGKFAFVLCECVCGTVKPVRVAQLLNGTSRQCAECGYSNRRRYGSTQYLYQDLRYRFDRPILEALSHEDFVYLSGRVNAAVYRCTREDHPQWHCYGGRGIRVCQEWLDDRGAFIEYLTTLAGCFNRLLWLDRVNNNGHYTPGNLRFVLPGQSALNRG